MSTKVKNDIKKKMEHELRVIAMGVKQELDNVENELDQFFEMHESGND